MIKKGLLLILTLITILSILHSGCIENLIGGDDNLGSLKSIYVDVGNNNGPWRGTQQDPFRYIQDAIDKAIIGSDIIISPGIYNENLVINTRVNITGAGPKQTTVNGNKTPVILQINVDNVSIKGLNILSNINEFSQYTYGIKINASSVSIGNCTIENNTYGIYIDIKMNESISSCQFNNNRYGIYTNYASKNIITENVFSSNRDYGIYLGTRSDNNVIADNILDGNNFAIRIKSSYDNNVTNNLFMDNQKGVYFCCNSKSNYVYLNRFYNSEMWHAQDDIPQKNYWYKNNQGNYWDDYNGTDNNSDGIGDTPYTFNYNSEDPYPLV